MLVLGRDGGYNSECDGDVVILAALLLVVGVRDSLDLVVSVGLSLTNERGVLRLSFA